ncbi:MAG: hypothetical protein EPN40_06960 [Rhodanobacteraceae bacterium]|nr:MAG: hypothetical protein EPN40_06960 [Rhodanobacteraceae bacterium]
MNTQDSIKRIRGRKLAVLLGLAMCGATGFAAAGTASAAQPDLDCKLTFTLTGWSAIYEHADGRGRVTCANGESMPVRIRVRGGGLTAGKWHINDGKGNFTDVYKVSDVLGNYAAASANAGIVKSGTAQVLSKGTVSLALAGAGQGINLGVSGTRFTISRADEGEEAAHRK